MLKPKGSITFASDESALLQIAMQGRDFGIKPSEILEVKNEVNAWSFDLACSFRLVCYDNERDAARLKLLLESVFGSAENSNGQKSYPKAPDYEEW